MPGGPASPVQLVAPAIAYHQSNSRGVTGTGPCERLSPRTPLNIHTHTHTQGKTDKQVGVHTHAQSWASLRVTALVQEEKRKEERDEEMKECGGRRRSRTDNTVIGHSEESRLQQLGGGMKNKTHTMRES